MKFERRITSLLAAALLCGASPATVCLGQAATPVASAAPSASATKVPDTPPLTEDQLRSRYVGKMVFLRGFYLGDDLHFDEDGKIDGGASTTSFTLSALEIRKVSLSKHKLDLESDRYGLHFFGALPYEDGSQQPYDKVKLSKKPIHITIVRELVVIPKVKKEKEKKSDQKVAQAPNPATPGQTAQSLHSTTQAQTSNTQPQTPTTQAQTASTNPAPSAPAFVPPPGTTTSPAHSAMLMNKALDNVFATTIDDRMLATLPDFWQEYFRSKNEHREFKPANVQALSPGITPPKVLNSIDPSSNELAQKYGIAGLTLFRTVVDSNGKPQQVAIARPIGFGLDEKAVDAIRASRFSPATESGHPVPVVIDLVVTFRIYSNRTKPGSVPKGAKPTQVMTSSWDQDGSKQSNKALQ